MSVWLNLFLLSGACALVCVPKTPGIALPAECSRTATLASATNETLVLILERTWPDTLSVAAFIATIECAFNGTLPDIASPIAFERAPRFTLGSAVRSSHLPSRHIVLVRAQQYAQATRSVPMQWRIGILPVLFVDTPPPATLQWHALNRSCAVHRARHAQRHNTLCTMASGARPSAPFLTTASYIDCDWAIGYYGVAEQHELPLDRMRFFFHMPRALKSDLLVTIAGVVVDYETVMFMDEDIVLKFNSTQWRAELECAFGHIPVLWRPTFRPYSKSIWQWMNADCFAPDVRALALGNFTFLEPQVFFVRADFFIHYVDQYIVPVFVQNPKVRCIWTLIVAVCLLAERAFPDAVACALSRTLIAVHADLRTLTKDAAHGADTWRILTVAMRYMPDTRHEFVPFDVVRDSQPCAPARTINTGRFEPWRPVKHTDSRMRQMINERIAQRDLLAKRLCEPVRPKPRAQ